MYAGNAAWERPERSRHPPPPRPRPGCGPLISQVDKHGPFRCMVRSNQGRGTGRDTRRAVGSWSH